MLGIIFYLRFLCRLDAKERPVPKSSFCSVVSKLHDDGQRVCRNMSQFKIRIQVVLDIMMFAVQLIWLLLTFTPISGGRRFSEFGTGEGYFSSIETWHTCDIDISISIKNTVTKLFL